MVSSSISAGTEEEEVRVSATASHEHPKHSNTSTPGGNDVSNVNEIHFRKGNGATNGSKAGVGPRIEEGDRSEEDSDTSDMVHEQEYDSEQIVPNRRRLKRGRSLRTNVLLRTKGLITSSANEIKTKAPGIVLTYGETTGESSDEIHILGPSTLQTNNSASSSHYHQGPSIGQEAKMPTGSEYSYEAFMHSWVPPRNAVDPLADTVWWGWAILFGTWVVFVMGMGSVLGVWEWVWDVGQSSFPIPSLFQTPEDDEDGKLPIPGYYPALLILTMVVAWVWVIVAWVGMKYFKHAKIQPQTDDT